ncbi:hypothetical protein D3C86_1229350 [compost metagenome]
MRGHPDAVAQVFGRLDLDVRQARVGNPVVLAVDEGLEHRAQAHVGVGQPFEGRAVDGAGDGGRAVEGTLAQVFGQPALAAALPQQRFDEQCQPFIGLAEDHRRARAGEHVGAQAFAAHGLAVHLLHGHGERVELGRDGELVERALPLPEHAQELRHEDAVLRVGGLGAHVVAQGLEGGHRVGGLEEVCGGRRHGGVLLEAFGFRSG